MQVQIEEINSVQRKILVDVPQEFVDKSYDSALRHVRGKVNIPGYRKGKAPLYLIKSQYESSLTEEVLDSIVRQFFTVNLAELNLPLAGQPEIKADPTKLKSGEAYQFAVLCDLEPQFELEEKYKNLKVSKSEFESTDVSFEAALVQLRRDQMKMIEKKDGDVDEACAAKSHDLVSFEQISAEVDSKKVESAILSKNDYLIGIDGSLWQDLDTKLTDLKVGDEFELAGKTTDSGIAPSFAREEVSYKAQYRVAAIKGAAVPELDQELAKELKFESLEALKTRVREDLENWAKNKTEQVFRGECLEMLRTQYAFELPPVVVDSQIDSMIVERVGANMGTENPEVKKFIQSMLKAEEVRSTLREEAKKIVHNTYILRKVAAAEGLEQAKPQDQAADDKQIMQTYDKALDKVISFAEITVEKVPLN